MKSLSVIGLMSGSSLDGADLAWVDFIFEQTDQLELKSWNICHGDTVEYSPEWQKRLKNAPSLSGKDLWQLHSDLGHLFGQQISDFIKKIGQKPDFIASHGHTVFHFPETKSTTQIGDGAAIAAELNMIVIDQFRALDIALGGQGAPLAPLGDQYFLPQYFACLNLGGISNISVKTPNGYKAFDVGGANQVLNALVEEINLPYDDKGQLARRGKLIPSLLKQVNSLAYFHQNYPKSLGNDWVQTKMLPLFQDKSQALNDRLHTACVQIAQQIGKDLKKVIEQENLDINNTDKILISGGGAFNDFLCELILKEIQPIQKGEANERMIAFKEAAFIALAGALRWLEQPNVLPKVTGARRAAVGGAIHYGRI